MSVSFMGLLGPNGPMPLHVTEYILGRDMAHDKTPACFLDMFNHRMVSLLYRAWAATQQAVNFEQGDDDRFAAYVGSLCGVGMPAFRGRDEVPDVAKLHFSGMLANQTKHAEGLADVLSDFFGVDVSVQEFVGRWVELPDPYCCRLGQSPETGTMGRTLIVGRRVWECQMTFRVVLGPMGLRDYLRLLPGGDSLPRLVAWIRDYAGDELAWDVQLILKKDSVPPTRLGQTGKLGWSTWLFAGPPKQDTDDLILRPFAAGAAMQQTG
jgi:type VI secretion system protein ImpH